MKMTFSIFRAARWQAHGVGRQSAEHLADPGVRPNTVRASGRNATRVVPAMRTASVVLGAVLIFAAAALVLPVFGSSDAYARSALYHLKTNGNLIRLRVTVNKSETIRVDKPFSEALIDNSKIADVMPLTDRSIYVLGKTVGTTRLSVLDSEKRVLGIVEIEVSHDMESLNVRLKEFVPGGDITVTSINGKLLMTGTVRDSVALERAIAIANQVAPNAVTNALTVTSSQQVLLEVRFVEVNRSATRDLGVEWNLVANKFIGLTEVASLAAGPIPPITRIINRSTTSNKIPFGTAIARWLGNGVEADLIVKALEERGLARRLAEPNLIALSGDTASFLAGGEFPFPVKSDDGEISIEFKKFGVGLSFTPTVLANGLINLKIEPEVSELDRSNSVRVGDVDVPSLIVRRAQTTVELRDGQSFAIAGLIKIENFKKQRELPWIGQVPVLGALFRSASFQKNETDLVIIVTPRLVKPKAPGETLITPLDKRIASNDIDFFLNGKQEINVGQHKPFTGHIIDLTDEPVGGGSKGAHYGVK